jgi:predicted dehydrogenase
MADDSFRKEEDGMEQGVQNSLGVGIIGTGFGLMHLLGYQACDNVQIVAVCQRTPGKAAAFAKQHGVPQAFTDYRELIAHPAVQVVSIAAPPYVHCEMTLAALAAGKPVLCEKPFAMNARQAQEMYERAQTSGLAHAMAFNWRFLPGVSYARELIAEGFVGHLYHANVTWYAERQADPNIPLLWRHRKEVAGFGVLGDIGPHVIDILRWILGDFRTVSAHFLTAIPERKVAGSGEIVAADADDACAFVAEMSSGVQVAVHLSRVAYASNCHRFEFYGSGGMLVYEADPKAGTWITGRLRGAKAGEKTLSEIPIPERLREGLNPRDLNVAVGSFLFAQLAQRFVHGIRTRQPVTPSFLEGLRSQEVIDALVRSAAEERWVQVTPGV